MFRAGEKDKIVRIVVELIPVSVVDDLVRRELPPELQFHDVTVLGGLLPIDRDVPVAAMYPAPADTPAVVSSPPGSVDTLARLRCELAASAGAKS